MNHKTRISSDRRTNSHDPMASSGLVIVDKPAGITSHDVVSELRKIFGTRKVGHAGTLDPKATGVLVAGIERGTKFMAHMTASTKSYTGTIRLGEATSTDDVEGEVVFRAADSALQALDDASIDHEKDHLTGDIMQRPTSVSAIRIEGRRAHARVRAGEDVDIPARPVTVSRFDITARRRDAAGYLDLDIEVDCSSGTYIRALARDLGAALGVGGHLIALRRTKVGPFTLSDARTLDELHAEEAPELSMTLDGALPRCYPTLHVTAEEGKALSMGKWLEPRGLQGTHAAVTPEGRAIALVKESGKRLATTFVARPITLL